MFQLIYTFCKTIYPHILCKNKRILLILEGEKWLKLRMTSEEKLKMAGLYLKKHKKSVEKKERQLAKIKRKSYEIRRNVKMVNFKIPKRKYFS